jgi:hypothetical protein
MKWKPMEVLGKLRNNTRGITAVGGHVLSGAGGTLRVRRRVLFDLTRAVAARAQRV